MLRECVKWSQHPPEPHKGREPSKTSISLSQTGRPDPKQSKEQWNEELLFFFQYPRVNLEFCFSTSIVAHTVLDKTKFCTKKICQVSHPHEETLITLEKAWIALEEKTVRQELKQYFRVQMDNSKLKMFYFYKLISQHVLLNRRANITALGWLQIHSKWTPADLY